MKTSKSPSDLSEQQKPDWTEVLLEVVVKILTLGFYHIKKHKG